MSQESKQGRQAFRDLPVGARFRFVEPSESPRWRTRIECVKISPRKYLWCCQLTCRIGSVSVEVEGLP